MSNSLQIHFEFSGDDLDPNEITATLGLVPADTHRKQNIYQKSSWSLSSEKIEDVGSFHEAIDAFLQTLYPHAAKFRSISERPGVNTCLCFWWVLPVGNEDGTRPAFHMNSKAIRFLAEVNADIGLDAYFRSD